MSNVLNGSPDYCQQESSKCEKRCFNDKRTSQIAEANWATVVKILKQFNSHSPTDSRREKKSIDN
jgi:hypothetical protein